MQKMNIFVNQNLKPTNSFQNAGKLNKIVMRRIEINMKCLEISSSNAQNNKQSMDRQDKSVNLKMRIEMRT